MDGFVQSIKQYPGQQQVDRSVKVKVPGKHFPQLQASESKRLCIGAPRSSSVTGRSFLDMQRRRGGASTLGLESDPICESDAIDDPDNKGFWTIDFQYHFHNNLFWICML